MCSNMNMGQIQEKNNGPVWVQWIKHGKKKKTKCWICIITELQEKRKKRDHSPSYLQAKEKELK